MGDEHLCPTDSPDGMWYHRTSYVTLRGPIFQHSAESNTCIIGKKDHKGQFDRCMLHICSLYLPTELTISLLRNMEARKLALSRKKNESGFGQLKKEDVGNFQSNGLRPLFVTKYELLLWN